VFAASSTVAAAMILALASANVSTLGVSSLRTRPQLLDGGWDCEFSIEEHETTGVTERAFYVPGVFPTPEAAIQAAVTAGVQKIDSGFEYKSTVQYRQ